MSNEFHIKRGDTSPKLIYTLSPTVNLVGATAVFNMTTAGGDAAIQRAAATIEDSAAGVVGFAFSSAQTATADSYLAEFEVTFSDGTVETYPNSEYIVVTIKADLG